MKVNKFDTCSGQGKDLFAQRKCRLKRIETTSFSSQVYCKSDALDRTTTDAVNTRTTCVSENVLLHNYVAIPMENHNGEKIAPSKLPSENRTASSRAGFPSSLPTCLQYVYIAFRPAVIYSHKAPISNQCRGVTLLWFHYTSVNKAVAASSNWGMCPPTPTPHPLKVLAGYGLCGQLATDAVAIDTKAATNQQQRRADEVVDAKKQKDILLSLLHQVMYTLDLCVPNKPEDKTYKPGIQDPNIYSGIQTFMHKSVRTTHWQSQTNTV
uniref:Uncharacterized protein n=1 Tax=Timema shepardi TaxID=629360 RepID=A0A7R9AMF9_TIMSH|nr:unnamed protein product [Timema shepardi]